MITVTIIIIIIIIIIMIMIIIVTITIMIITMKYSLMKPNNTATSDFRAHRLLAGSK